MITLFGPGVAYGTRTDASGTTPCNFGKVKSVAIDASFTVKPLTGQWQAPLDFGRGTLKLGAKLKLAAFSPLAFMNLVWGVSSASGETLTQFLEAHTVPGTPYQVTVTNPTGFSGPLEVLYAATGLPFTQVGSSPAQGQYSVNTSTGVLTFNSADTGAAILVSYSYTTSSGYNLAVTNQLQGFTPTFSLVFYNTKNGKPVTYSLPFCTSEKLNRDFKEDDFANPEIDILVGANAAGQIIVENYAELS